VPTEEPEATGDTVPEDACGGGGGGANPPKLAATAGADPPKLVATGGGGGTVATGGPTALVATNAEGPSPGDDPNTVVAGVGELGFGDDPKRPPPDALSPNAPGEDDCGSG